MLTKIRNNYTHTIYACYLGYISQAVTNNLAPLLFLTFQHTWGLTLSQITTLSVANFGTQLLIDLLSAVWADKVGYRTSMVIAHVFSTAGLLGMAFLPDILPNAFIGLMLSAIFYGIGGGLVEVLVSPVVEACPTAKKEAAMSLLHSFYCWGLWRPFSFPPCFSKSVVSKTGGCLPVYGQLSHCSILYIFRRFRFNRSCQRKNRHLLSICCCSPNYGF